MREALLATEQENREREKKKEKVTEWGGEEGLLFLKCFSVKNDHWSSPWASRLFAVVLPGVVTCYNMLKWRI